MVEKKNKMTLILLSGDLDKVMAAYIIASGAAASGTEVVIFYTFWLLGAVTAFHLSPRPTTPAGPLRGGLSAIGPSRLNMGGMGRWMFKLMMKQKNVAQLPELREACLALGVKMLPCQMSMDVMEIVQDDLIPEAEPGVGVATMLEHAQESSMMYFI